MITDFWKAYPEAARVAEVGLLQVNHSEGFKNPHTGVHSNNVEGVHALLKTDARRQFGRLPYLTASGQPYYIDLICWRVNTKLQRGEDTAKLFKEFCVALNKWTNDPLDDFVHVVPMYQEEETEEAEYLEDSDGEFVDDGALYNEDDADYKV